MNDDVWDCCGHARGIERNQASENNFIIKPEKFWSIFSYLYHLLERALIVHEEDGYGEKKPRKSIKKTAYKRSRRMPTLPSKKN